MTEIKKEETLEDIFGEQDPFEDKSDIVSDVSKEISKDLVQQDTIIKQEPKFVIPKIFGGPMPSEYKQIVDRWLSVYKRLPVVDFEAVYNELGLLAVDSTKTPTLQHLNEQLQQVQASKDRLAEIMKDILLAHTIKKRAVDVLKDAWGRFTSERNAESRKGDSVVRVSDFERDFAEIDGLLKACNHILKNLDSLHENLSRRVSVIQLEVKIHDMGRGGLPEFSFNRIDPDDYEDLMGKDNSEVIDHQTPVTAEESSF